MFQKALCGKRGGPPPPPQPLVHPEQACFVCLYAGVLCEISFVELCEAAAPGLLNVKKQSCHLLVATCSVPSTLLGKQGFLTGAQTESQSSSFLRALGLALAQDCVSA